MGSLCEAYRWATRFDEAGHHVDLLFDAETKYLKVDSIYTHGALGVMLKQPGPLWIRIPSWVEQSAVALEGATDSTRLVGNYLFVTGQPVGQPLKLRYELPLR